MKMQFELSKEEVSTALASFIITQAGMPSGDYVVNATLNSKTFVTTVVMSKKI